MRQDLEALKQQIEVALERRGCMVYRGLSRIEQDGPVVAWDTGRHPDADAFLDVAQRLGVRLVVLHTQELSGEMIEEAREKLGAARLERDEHRECEGQLKRLEGYAGFTCLIELSFDYEGRTYIYEVTTPWYQEFDRLIDDLEEALEISSDGDPGPMPGYFSNN